MNTVGIASPHTHTHKQTHLTQTASVASVPPTTILLNPIASTRAGNFGGRRTFLQTDPLYLPGGRGQDTVEQRASLEHVCLFHHCTEDLNNKHVLLLTRQDVLSSATRTFLSINHSRSHTHADKFSFSRGSVPITEKKYLNRPDLLGSK